MGAAKIAVSLPPGLLGRLEEARRATRQSRSELIAEAIEALLAEREAKSEAQAYREGYLRLPESAEEAATIDIQGATLLAEEPWE